MTTHEFYMKRCIELAKNGLGTTYPNPLVGSVIVHEGKIIGEGWHKKAGTRPAFSLIDVVVLFSSLIFVINLLFILQL